MLQRIYADNYRCLVNFEFRPQKLNLLVGDNGSGKTSLFDVLGGIQAVVGWGSPVQDVFPTATLTRWEERNTQRFELELDGNQGVYQYLLEVTHDRQKESSSILNERLQWDGMVLYQLNQSNVKLVQDDGSSGPVFPFDPHRSFLSVLDARPNTTKLTWFKEFVSKLWAFKLNPSAMKALSQKEQHWLEPSGENFVSWYRGIALEYPDAIQALSDDMKRVIEGFQTLKLASAGGGAKEFRIRFAAGPHESAKGYELSLEELSDGQRALLALYTMLHVVTRSASVVCFDEPDNFVALNEIQPWLLRLVDALDDSQGQALIISHHPESIDYLAADSAFKFERAHGDLVRVKPLDVARDTGLKASEVLARGWENEQA